MTIPDISFRTPALIDLTQELVRVPSVLGNEGEVAQLVLARMQSLGFDRAEVDQAGNIVGVIRGLHPGPTLLLDAHMDTVDVVAHEKWRRAPFGAEVVGDRIYGRGASDMKGALAGMILAAAALSRDQLAGSLVVSASVNEELIEGAALRLVMEAYSPDFVVIGESSQLDIVRCGRGRAEFVLEAHGEPAHSSSPSLGRNAIHDMVAVISEVERIVPPSHPATGNGVMCLTDIISTPYPAHSVVPSGCRVTYERRLVPGETQLQVRHELEDACRKAGRENVEVRLAEARVRSYTGHQFEQPKWFPAWMIQENHELVEKSLRALRKIKLNPRLTSYQFCTNAAYSAGVAGVPTVGFGPSRESLAHVRDEYIEIDQLVRASAGYFEISRSLLGVNR